MADISDINFKPALLLPTLLEVEKIEDVLYNADGTRKTLAEVTAICCGTFDPRFCSGVEEFYNSKDFRCFLGYTHIKLSVFPAFIELPWNALGDNTFTVTANKPWFIRDYYPSSFFSINKTSGGAGNTFVTVTAKSVNTGELPRHASFTVVCGSKELTVLINQDFEEGAIIHQ